VDLLAAANEADVEEHEVDEVDVEEHEVGNRVLKVVRSL
jgi:hypothetical protein